MRVSARPSKTFLWSLLDKDLANIRGETGIDAASAQFKSYPYFATDNYYGVDISLPALQKGRRQYPKGIGLYGNLATLNLPKNCADVLVSTNTLYQLSKPNRLLAIKNMCDVVKPTGALLVEVGIDELHDKMLSALEDRFRNVYILYYQNSLSQFYERHFEQNGHLGRNEITNNKFLLMVSLLLSKLEHLTCHNHRGKQHAYIKCLHKKNDGPIQRLNTKSLEMVELGIYRC